jgi:hypothetical protein
MALNMTKTCLIAIGLCLLASSSFGQSKTPEGGWPIIYISFEKFGKAINPLLEREAEAGDSSRSKEKGSDVWLRLHNNYLGIAYIFISSLTAQSS